MLANEKPKGLCEEMMDRKSTENERLKSSRFAVWGEWG